MGLDEHNPASNIADVHNDRNIQLQGWLRQDVLQLPPLWDTSKPAVDGALRSTLLMEEDETIADVPQVSYVYTPPYPPYMDVTPVQVSPPNSNSDDMRMLYLTYNMQMVLAFVMFAALVYALAETKQH